jgi:hypothetical protein
VSVYPQGAQIGSALAVQEGEGMLQVWRVAVPADSTQPGTAELKPEMCLGSSPLTLTFSTLVKRCARKRNNNLDILFYK